MTAQWPASTAAEVGRIPKIWRFTQVEAHSALERALCEADLVRQANGQWIAESDSADPSDLDSFEFFVGSPEIPGCRTETLFVDTGTRREMELL